MLLLGAGGDEGSLFAERLLPKLIEDFGSALTRSGACSGNVDAKRCVFQVLLARSGVCTSVRVAQRLLPKLVRGFNVVNMWSTCCQKCGQWSEMLSSEYGAHKKVLDTL